jgi:hypothetical protein
MYQLRKKNLADCVANYVSGSLEDDPCEGHPKSATTPEIIQQVHDVVFDDWQVLVRETAERIGISREHVGYMLHEEFNMNKPCASWVTRSHAHPRKSLNNAWSILTKIKLILCVDLLLVLWMRHRFTITHQKPNSSQNSEQKPIVQRQIRKGQFHQQER